MTLTSIIAIAGRGLLALLFVLAGITKLTGPAPFREHMAQLHIPVLLLPAVALFEVGAGTALMLGWYPLFAAGALSLFCIATAAVFHRNFSERAERTQFIKDVALAGALAFVAAAAAA